MGTGGDRIRSCGRSYLLVLVGICAAGACGSDSDSDDRFTEGGTSSAVTTNGDGDMGSDTQSSDESDTSTSTPTESSTDGDATDTGASGAMFIPPIERQVMVDGQMQTGYVLEFTDGTDTTAFECIAEKGGLITAWKLNGQNILLDDANPSTLDGSTFWPSPQSDWNWPPPAAIDASSYTVTVDEANMSVHLVGPADDGLALRVEKRFTIDLEREAVLVEYTMVNTGTNARSFAPWEISRVPPTALTFYPTGSNSPTSGSFQPIPVTESGGVTWFEHSSTSITGQHKLFADGDRGWLAHTRDDMVMVKSFDDEPASSAAPNEAEIEIYATPDYAEVEQQGAYASIPAMGSTSWTVTWFLRPMPAEASATAGDQALVDFVDALPSG